MTKYLTAIVALLTGAASSFAQSSGSVTLRGSVNSIIAINVAPLTGYNMLDLVNGMNDQPVANVTEKCNAKAGYTVRLTSLNAGTTGNTLILADTAGGPGSDWVAYSLRYDGAVVTFANGGALLTNSNGRTPGAGITKPLAVTVVPVKLKSGTYADTLTFTITAK